MSGFKCLFSPLLKMEEMVSQSATFQSLTGSPDAATALSRIRLFSFVEEFAEEEDLRLTEVVPLPRASIFPLAATGVKGNTYSPTVDIRIGVEVEIEIPSAVLRTHDAEIRYAGPIFESIFDELMQLGSPPSPGGSLNIIGYNIIQTPYPCDKDERVDGNGDQLRVWVCGIEFQVAG